MALTDYVLMPGVDFQAICNAIRTKTGKTAAIKSGDAAAEIESIAAGDIKIAGGTFTGNGSGVTVTHNLGAKPDLVVAILNGSGTTGTGTNTATTGAFFGVSSALKSALELTHGQLSCSSYSNGAMYMHRLTSEIESGNKRTVHSVTETTFIIGGEFESTFSEKTYTWIAVAGLT